jgi:hypothetical protein
VKSQTPKRNTAGLTVDKSAFDAIMRKLIASGPIRKDDLKPKRKTKRAKEAVLTGTKRV